MILVRKVKFINILRELQILQINEVIEINKKKKTVPIIRCVTVHMYVHISAYHTYINVQFVKKLFTHCKISLIFDFKAKNKGFFA